MKKILSLRHRKKISNPTIESSIWFSAPSPPWIDLPTDLTANILHRLGPEEILRSAQFVCATWWKVCKDPSTWRVIHMIDHPGNEHLEIFRYLATDDLSYFIPATICRRAVERSQGGLINISIGHFCTENLLLYISDRSSRLKRLSIASPRITSSCLIAAVKRLGGKQLEELSLFYTPFNAFEDMETIGICCHRLNTLAFNNRWCRFPVPPPKEADDRCALAIAKNMPNLRHLQLNANVLTEKGLQAILDGCPCLESLDLRRSHVVGDSGDLRKRCSWIKDVRLPCDSTWLDDYESEDEEYDRREGDRYRVVHIPAINEDAEMNCRTGTLIFKGKS